MTGRIFLAFWLAVVIPLSLGLAAYSADAARSCTPPDFAPLRC